MIAVKVVHNVLEDVYEVYARRWWSRWSFQRQFGYDGEGIEGLHYRNRTTAEAKAIAYAKSLLSKQVVFKSSNFFY